MAELEAGPLEEIPPGEMKLVDAEPYSVGVYNCDGELYALEQLGEIPGVALYGPPADRRAGIVSFNVEGVHPHDVAQILDLDAIAIRASHHCCQPLMRRLGVAATNRASFYLYNTAEDVDKLAAGVRRVIAIHS